MAGAMPIVGSPPRVASYDILLWQTQLDAIDLAGGCGGVERAADIVGHLATFCDPDRFETAVHSFLQ